MGQTRLDQLPVGQTAIITAIDRADYDASVFRRLCEMGFDEGVDVEVLHMGPIGRDPIALRVGNMQIAIRRAEAALIRVEPAAAATGTPLAEAAE